MSCYSLLTVRPIALRYYISDESVLNEDFSLLFVQFLDCDSYFEVAAVDVTSVRTSSH